MTVNEIEDRTVMITNHLWHALKERNEGIIGGGGGKRNGAVAAGRHAPDFYMEADIQSNS